MDLDKLKPYINDDILFEKLKNININIFENDDYKYIVSFDRIILESYKKKDTVIEIPEKINGISVEIIGENAFAHRTFIKKVTIPESVTLIDDGAFLNCLSLETVIIPKSIEIISDWVFESCTKLQKIIFKGRNSLDGIHLCVHWKDNCNTEIIFEP